MDHTSAQMWVNFRSRFTPDPAIDSSNEIYADEQTKKSLAEIKSNLSKLIYYLLEMINEDSRQNTPKSDDILEKH